MTKFREQTVIPQIVHPKINGEVLYPFGPPVYRTELDTKIVDMLIAEGQRTREQKDLDHRLKLAGNMKSGTSVLFPAGPDKDVRNRADQAIVQKVFEFFEILQSQYGKDWPNIEKMMLGNSGGMGALRLQQLWINFQQAGDYNPLHDHGGLFSFVIFGDIDEKIFTEDVPPTNTNIAGKLIFHYGEQITKLQSNSFSVEPYKGLMYVFPAALQHTVPPYFKEFERISISGNYVLEQNQPQSKLNPVKLNLEDDKVAQMMMNPNTDQNNI
tara:strand:+ start:843 stop:1649 length:807 start_codon:yes stop_codon:yes gene_type:complete